MYHRPSKRILFLRKVIVLVIMWTAVITGVVVLFALTLGYSFNKKSGHIEQGGILQMNSQPSGATIFLNDQQYSSQTPSKFVSEPSTINVKMQKNGYHDWQKQVPIQPGNITWAAYPRLIPKKLSPDPVTSLPASLSGALSSSGNNYYAFMEKADEPRILIADISTETVQTKTITIPSTAITQPAEGKAQEFEIELWSGDEKSLLLKHTYGDTVEWLMVPTVDPEKTVNITTYFGIKASKLLFASGNGRKLFVQEGDSVKLLSIDDQTASRPYVTGVSSFEPYDGETILYATIPKDGKQNVGYVKKDFKSPVVLTTLPYDGTHLVKYDMSKYYDTYNLLVGSAKEATLYAVKDLPTDTSDMAKFSLKHVADLTTPQDIVALNLTENGQFATIQDGSSITTYNLEIKKMTSALVGRTEQPQKYKYLDTYLLWGTRDGKMHTVEFDGENQHDIMAVDQRFDVSLSRSGKYLYGIAKKSDGTYEFQRVQLLDIPTT